MIKDDKKSLIWEHTVNSIFFRMTLYFVSFFKENWGLREIIKFILMIRKSPSVQFSFLCTLYFIEMLLSKYKERTFLFE